MTPVVKCFVSVNNGGFYERAGDDTGQLDEGDAGT